MDELLELLFGSGRTPVRRDVWLRLTYDQEGNPALVPVQGEAFTLSQEGSIDRVLISQERFYHCGCSGENQLGGQCGEPECGRTSCIQCFSRCFLCSKPLCLEHTGYVEAREGTRVPLCAVCEDSVRTRLFWSRLTRGLLPPGHPH